LPALRLIIEGIVQGVGFRPFIHRIALTTGVKGYVRNAGGAEVEVLAEGTYKELSSFIRKIIEEHPLPAIIESIEIFTAHPKHFQDFRIMPSSKRSIKRSMIPPDFAICDDCLREINDPNNRRYRYAFNSCAWCGPRYSMMYKSPYDRENTSMSKYRLCPKCLEEYRDISNIRRYHAQGISCPEDGPKLTLTDDEGNKLDVKDPISEAGKLVDEGYIIAVKGLGGYHIASLASDDDVVIKLRQRKNRPTKPFAVMGLDIEVISKLVHLHSKAIKILKSPQRPIILLPKREDSPASKYVSPGMDVEGVFTPYTGLHYLLLKSTNDKFLIMTSGNSVGKPMCIDEDCAYRRLRGIADYFLVHDREIVNRVDDSVLRFTDEEPVLLRRGRGYAPKWFRLSAKLPREVIALGAELQTAGAVGFEDKVVLTQFIGDLSDIDALRDMDKYLKFFIRNYRLNTQDAIIVIDKHPHYSSRLLGLSYAKEWGSRAIELQHHYAHALSAGAEANLIGKQYMAVVVDGVGYGDDGSIWGGEVLEIAPDLSYSRIGHLQYLPLIGDESTVRPARYLASALLTIMDIDEVTEILKASGAIKGLRLGLKEIMLLDKAIKAGKYVNSSSTGRFLDAVSAYLGVRLLRTYEGEPAIALEAFSRGGKVMDDLLHTLSVRSDDNGILILNLSEFLKELAYRVSPDLNEAKSIGLTAQYGVGYGLGKIVIHRMKGLRKEIADVIISGGAGVNDYVVRGLRKALGEEGLSVKLPHEVPMNDGGIALGQVVSTLNLRD